MAVREQRCEPSATLRAATSHTQFEWRGDKTKKDSTQPFIRVPVVSPHPRSILSTSKTSVCSFLNSGDEDERKTRVPVVKTRERCQSFSSILKLSNTTGEGRSQRSSLFKTMFLAFRANGAKDWCLQVAIALDHSGSQHKLQFHHIFPKAILKSSHTSRESDDIANLCFISGKTNRQISDKPPNQYFAQILGKIRARAV
jgi:hypothetical protein